MRRAPPRRCLAGAGLRSAHRPRLSAPHRPMASHAGGSEPRPTIPDRPLGSATGRRSGTGAGDGERPREERGTLRAHRDAADARSGRRLRRGYPRGRRQRGPRPVMIGIAPVEYGKEARAIEGDHRCRQRASSQSSVSAARNSLSSPTPNERSGGYSWFSRCRRYNCSASRSTSSCVRLVRRDSSRSAWCNSADRSTVASSTIAALLSTLDSVPLRRSASRPTAGVCPAGLSLSACRPVGYDGPRRRGSHSGSRPSS